MGEARSVVEGFYDAFNRGDLDGVRQYFAEDTENVDPTGTLRGWEAFRQFIQGFKDASPDAKLVARRWVEEGPVVVAEGLFEGTFTGPLRSPAGELPPTGKSYALPFMEINEVEGGRITKHRVYYDQVSFMAALGVQPPPG